MPIYGLLSKYGISFGTQKNSAEGIPELLWENAVMPYGRG